MRYFIDESRRMVRTIEDGDPTPPERWVEVTSKQWDAFRKETKTITPKKLKAMRALP